MWQVTMNGMETLLMMSYTAAPLNDSKVPAATSSDTGS